MMRPAGMQNTDHVIEYGVAHPWSCIQSHNYFDQRSHGVIMDDPVLSRIVPSTALSTVIPDPLVTGDLAIVWRIPN